jgi:hypothetical protein
MGHRSSDASALLGMEGFVILEDVPTTVDSRVTLGDHDTCWLWHSACFGELDGAALDLAGDRDSEPVELAVALDGMQERSAALA